MYLPVLFKKPLLPIEEQAFMHNKISSHCFAPLSLPTARLLILGSYPGVMSLEENEYYAHPRNVFWDIMSEIIGFDRSLVYLDRAAALQHAGIALWDVLYSCRRTGSLDSKIESISIVINDFESFFSEHPLIKAIVFNGGKAELEFRRRVIPAAAGQVGSKPLLRLPSTSPAMASMPYAQKLESWRVIKDFLR